MAKQEIKAAGRIRSFILNQNNVVSMPNASNDVVLMKKKISF